MAFLGCKSKKEINLTTLHQELMKLVPKVKFVIFPNKKKWKGFAFLLFHTNEQLEEFVVNKKLDCPKTGVVFSVKRHNQDKKIKKNKLKDRNLRTIFFERVPISITQEDIVACIKKHGLMKALGQKFSEDSS